MSNPQQPDVPPESNEFAGTPTPPPQPNDPPGYQYAYPAGAPIPRQNADIGGAVNWAFTKFGQNWQVLGTFALAIMVINLISQGIGGAGVRFDSTSGISGLFGADVGFFSAVALIGFGLLSFIAQLGLINSALRITRGERAEFSDFWDARFGLTYVIVTALFLGAVGFGMALCFIPGLLALWAWQFARYAAVDPALSVTESFGESWRLVRDNKGIAVLTMVVMAAGSILTFLTCGIGALVIQPLMALFMAHVYRELRGEAVAA